MKDFALKLKDNNDVLDEDRIKNVIKKAVEDYGKQLSMTIVTEELSELQKEISKQARNIGDYYNLLEEMADVVICIEFTKYVFDIPTNIIKNAINDKTKCEKINDLLKPILCTGDLYDASNDINEDNVHTLVSQCINYDTASLALINNGILADLQYQIANQTFYKNSYRELIYAVASVIITIKILKRQYSITSSQLNQAINTKIARLEEVHY